MNKFFGAMVGVPMVLVAGGMSAEAQQRPDGIRAGAFYLQPSVTTSLRHDSNLFNEQGNNAESDVIFNISPQLVARTARRVHFLEFSAGASADFHFENEEDNSVDLNAGVRGRYDISRKTNVRAEAQYLRAHDNRGDDNAIGQAEPTFFNVYRGLLAARTQPNRLSFELSGDVRYEDYEDADANNNDDDRDVTIYGVGARVGYEARKGYTVFVTGRYDVRDFNDAVDDVNIRRGSDGYRVRAGVAYRPSAKVRASASVGYLSRSYDEPTFSDVDGIDVNADVRWEVSRKTELGLAVRRSIDEVADDNQVAGRLSLGVTATATQQVGRNMQVKGTLGYRNAQEEGNVGNREDDTYSAGVEADYAFHRAIKAGAFASYERRVSSDADGGHVKTIVGVRLKVGF